MRIPFTFVLGGVTASVMLFSVLAKVYQSLEARAPGLSQAWAPNFRTRARFDGGVVTGFLFQWQRQAL